MAEPKAGDEHIDIELDGDTLQLKPSIGACKAICKMHGGLIPTRNRVLGLDFETIEEIIALGLEVQPRMRKELEQKIYRSGLIKISAPVFDFCLLVGNGGLYPDADAPQEEADADPREPG